MHASFIRASKIFNSSFIIPPIIKIDNATFYRKHPSQHTNRVSNPPIFPGLTFSVESSPKEPENWAVIGASSSGKTTFLEVLRGLHLCSPHFSRTLPYLSSKEIIKKDGRLRSPLRDIQYVGFSSERGGFAGQGAKGSYLSARYESRREETDFSVLDYLKGNTRLNALEVTEDLGVNDGATDILQKVVKDLKLEALVDMPIGNLSNGQTRRAMIAKALLSKPEVLLLDEPFMGLDPPTLMTLSPLLERLTLTNSPRLVLALRPQDPLPEWITHLIYLDPSLRIASQGPKSVVLRDMKNLASEPGTESFGEKKFPPVISLDQLGHPLKDRDVGEGKLAQGGDKKKLSSKQEKVNSIPPASCSGSTNEPLVEMKGVRVAYGEKQVLGYWQQDVDGHSESGLWWTIRKGERWGIFGPNGSGKTTILSLICSDHPQAYSLPIKIFGQSRLPLPGQPCASIFDIQARIGHSSPEVHAFFPRHITLRQALENAWADTFLGKPILNDEREAAVDACLRWFRPELDPSFNSSNSLSDGLTLQADRYQSSGSSIRKYENLALDENDWADYVRFGDVPFSSQRILLFLRAIIKKPDLIILDEAFSGMDDILRLKCMLFLERGEMSGRTALNRVGKSIEMRGDSNTTEELNLSMHGISQDQALICVSHVKEEVPGVVRDWLCLPEAATGQPVRFGHLESPLGDETKGWNEIWGM